MAVGIWLHSLFPVCWPACGGSPPVAPRNSRRRSWHAPPGIRSVALVPCVDMARIYGINHSTRSPITGKTFVTGFVADDAAALFDSLILQQVDGGNRFQVISPRVVRGELELLMSGKSIGISEREKVLELGQKTGADAVMAGYIYRFEERKGSNYAAEKPASVAFDLHLIRVADGRVLWSGHFKETQQALTDNLYEFDSFVKRGAKWVTARDMAADAIAEMLSGSVEEASQKD
jgi:hypothetical protein